MDLTLNPMPLPPKSPLPRLRLLPNHLFRLRLASLRSSETAHWSASRTSPLLRSFAGCRCSCTSPVRPFAGIAAAQGTDIPEEVLPAPFNEQMLDPVLTTNEATSSNCPKVSSSHLHQESHQVVACHVSQSFRRHFSRMSSDKKTENFTSNVLEADGQLPPIQAQDSSPYKKSPSENTCPTTCSVSISPISPPDTKSSLAGSDTPQITGIERTPVKLASTLAKLMVNTPILQSRPRSCSLSPDDDSIVVAKSVNRPSVARSLKFDCLEKNAHVELELDDVESTDILEILPQSLVQSLKENEKKTEEQTLRRRILNRLPMLFDRIYYLFQSIKYSAVRKEALLHRLTTCHIDIVDESEVEEQLKLLQEVLPDWISQKLSPSSNVLLSICKSLDPSVLRAKLQKNPPPWGIEQTKSVRVIKDMVKSLPCIGISQPKGFYDS